MKTNRSARIAVDIGGTFTDIALEHAASLHTAKTLTTADDPVRGVIDGRGGLGQIIEVESHEGQPFDFFGTVDRVKYPARGCFGGRHGAPGKLALRSGKQMQGKGKQPIPAGESLIFQTPGGGGYGDPHKRPPQQVAQDCAAGLVSRKAARQLYGVCLKRDGSVDVTATRARRRA